MVWLWIINIHRWPLHLSAGYQVSGMQKKPFWLAVPPWIILGAMAVLVPLFAFMTLQTINLQQQLTTQLLLEKGDALIKAFEAGARTGLDMQWGSFQIQKLLLETARQPGVDYLIITDGQGKILADSDPGLVGDIHGGEIDLSSWRRARLTGARSRTPRV